MPPTEHMTLPDSYRVPSRDDSVLIAEDDAVCRMILQTWLKTQELSAVNERGESSGMTSRTL